ncbi:hypothetical protein [Cellulomonas carbonis]|uniref:hypothetical protein n=1 Tax=Cellulomonas carbonis TaxID=1386092 RepID=UPI000A3E7299|nr:hypothetical protein [Cellulomonas carbonis]MDT0166342.1 hypothetical protein [Actinotalea sp. AC32]GGC01802.1 hypothetical protein GCM10010972_13360 [Cellulomonas carbonis]
MGDFATANAALAASHEPSTSTLAVPPQVLARWAALAGARGCLAALPTQVRTA